MAPRDHMRFRCRLDQHCHPAQSDCACVVLTAFLPAAAQGPDIRVLPPGPHDPNAVLQDRDAGVDLDQDLDNPATVVAQEEMRCACVEVSLWGGHWVVVGAGSACCRMVNAAVDMDQDLDNSVTVVAQEGMRCTQSKSLPWGRGLGVVVVGSKAPESVWLVGGVRQCMLCWQ